MNVPYANLSRQSSTIKAELLQAAEQVLVSGNYILGPEVSAFEKKFAGYCGSPYAIGVSNGTTSLYMIYRALGIGPGDEIITVPNTFLATVSTMALVGAKPVFVDIGEDLNIDVDQIENAITSRTKAIVPVHLTGRPAKMDRILEIATKKNLSVIEDAAQAVGAKYKNRRVGSWGDVSSFSLHPLKNLYALGDAGIVTTSYQELRDSLALARNHGLKNRTDCEFWSLNARLDEMQAAFLNVQMNHLDRWTEERRKLAFVYHEALGGLVKAPVESASEYHVYQTYMIQCDRRDDLMAYCVKNGVDVKIHYPVPLHHQKPAAVWGYGREQFPKTIQACQRILSLPLYPGMTTPEQEHVIRTVRSFYEG